MLINLLRFSTFVMVCTVSIKFKSIQIVGDLKMRRMMQYFFHTKTILIKFVKKIKIFTLLQLL